MVECIIKVERDTTSSSNSHSLASRARIVVAPYGASRQTSQFNRRVVNRLPNGCSGRARGSDQRGPDIY